MTWKNNKPAKGFVNKPASGSPARGIGWGGEASGKEPKPWTRDDRPSEEAINAGREAAKTAREIAKHHAVEMAGIMLEIARDVTLPAPTRLEAANKMIDRAEGRPAQSVGGTDDLPPIKHVVTWEDGE